MIKLIVKKPPSIVKINKVQSHFLILSLLFLFACASPTTSTAQTVYVTKTGKKYHTESCRYLSHSKISLSLTEAKKKYYEACKVCKPTTVITSEKSATVDTIKVYKPVKKAVSSRCTATTKSGSRCKRMTKNASGKCWQHE